jgi:hypothetical protein
VPARVSGPGVLAALGATAARRRCQWSRTSDDAVSRWMPGSRGPATRHLGRPQSIHGGHDGDRQLQLALTDTLAYAYSPKTFRSGFRPARWLSRRRSDRARDLCVRRDVHYTHSDAVPGDWSLEKPPPRTSTCCWATTVGPIDGRRRRRRPVSRTAIVGRFCRSPASCQKLGLRNPVTH